MENKRAMKKRKTKTRALNVRVTEDDYKALKEIAVDKGLMFRSIAARLAIQEWINNYHRLAGDRS